MLPLPRVIAILAFSVAALSAEDLKLPADWPPSWAEAYRRYEQFLTDKKTYFPVADFEIGDSGGIRSNIQWYRKSGEALTFDFYMDGIRQMLPGSDEAPDIRSLLPGKKYPVVAISRGLLGYQFLYPFRWVEIKDSGIGNRVVQMVSPPKDPETYWPNERLFSYRDFTAFPLSHRDALYIANNKVTPCIKLEVSNDGTIHRDRLDPNLEKHLRWRIYRDDRLIEKGLVSPSLTRPSPAKPGEYHVFLGIEGPGGFMPVSNELNFPLFPDGRGGVCVYPETRKLRGVPDFILALMTGEEKNRLGKEMAEGDWTAQEYAVSDVVSDLDPKRPDDRKLLDLWDDWLWHLNQSRGGDERLRFRVTPSPQ